MSAESNKELLRTVCRLINERDRRVVELYAPDFRYHGPGGQELEGRQGMWGLWTLFLSAFPDLRRFVDDLVSEGDRVVARMTLRGTHQREFLGVPASHRRVALQTVEIFRVADGLLAEAWDHYDRMDLMDQIGAVDRP